VPTPDRAGPAARVSLERAVGPEALGLYEAALARLRPAERRAVRDRIELQRPYGRLARELGLANAAEARAVVVRALGRLLSRMGA
jgi:hypothetical protein